MQKSAYFEKSILDFYHKAGRENLPWRKEDITAYEVWVSETMLQQTQVSRVIDYYTQFLQRFPTVDVLARASWEEFLPYYAGLGYYRRGRNMLIAAHKIVSDFGGEFPRDKKRLMTLPGVGDYTASAIVSFAYDENHLAWDTNLKRVIGRFFYGSKQATIRYDAILFESRAKIINAALMDFGSAICAGRPKCKICPLSNHCVYFSQNGTQEVALKKQSTSDASAKLRWKDAQAYVWLHKDHALYYSAHPHQWDVFVLPKEYNSRAGIKAYFKEKYDLDLAVRPPHQKVSLGGVPTLFVNAQILLGEPLFATFSKDVVKTYNEAIGKDAIVY